MYTVRKTTVKRRSRGRGKYAAQQWRTDTAWEIVTEQGERPAFAICTYRTKRAAETALANHHNR